MRHQRHQGLQLAGISLLLALVAQNSQSLQPGLVGSRLILEYLLASREGYLVQPFFLVLPSPEQLLHSLELIPLLVVFAELAAVCELLDDDLTEVYVGL